MDCIKIKSCGVEDYARLESVWEDAVRASHGFLSECDIAGIKEKLSVSYFPSVELFGVESAAGFVAFIGFSGNKIEMLFVASAYQGSGIGSRLIAFAKERGMRFVDVNEQNQDALDFYKKHGFKLVSRDEYDDAGRPFPILHLMSEE